MAGVPRHHQAGRQLIVRAHRSALPVSYLVGAALVAWIILQALVLERFFIMQPIIAVLGLLEVLAWSWQRSTSA